MNPGSGLERNPGVFSTTLWTVVMQTSSADEKAGALALERLCELYWRPVYLFVRKHGQSAEDAEDLTQEFFSHLLERDFFASARPERGRFRSFLRVSLKHFLINEWERAKAQKRGGGRRLIPLEGHSVESRFSKELSQELSADQVYDRQWALTLLDRVRDSLRDEYASRGKAERFALLAGLLPGAEAAADAEEVGRRLGISATSVRTEVHRLKHRFGQLLREEIAHTVADPKDIDAEIHYLIEIVG